MTSMTVRRAQPEDLERLAQLCISHAAYEGGMACAADLPGRLGKALFGTAPRALAWVVESHPDSGAVGFATASPVFSTWQCEDFLHLDCLFLIESARGHGAGRLLIEAVRMYAVSCGFLWLEWQTPAWNAAAIGFYEKLGATAAAKQRFTLTARAT